ncbi:MAG: hypothetical protein L0221_15840 [Chloroflexi bacterium]|nr:hypothetical protein [Chloroflexota bacterium]
MAHPRTRPGGHVLWSTGEKITSADLNEVGTMALQSLFNGVLARLVQSDVDGDPIEGFVGDDCLVTVSADLTLDIAAGFGVFYDTTAADEFGTVLKPICVPATFQVTLGARDATNLRVDIVCLAPAITDDQSESRNVKDPSDGSLSTTSVNKRRQLYYASQVVAGTPAASPTAPATPSGYIKLAECRVPATAGAVLIDDFRPRLVFGADVSPDPGADYASNFVPGSSTELSVGETSPASMAVLVQGGEAVILGQRFRHGRQKLAVTAADATNPRIDLVVANADGTLSVVAGTPAGSPTAPTAAADQANLAQIAVAALQVSVVGANITDTRIRQPVSASQLRDLCVSTSKLAASAVTTAKIADLGVTTAKIDDLGVTANKLASNAVTTTKITDGNVTGAKLSVMPVIPDLSIGAETANARQVTIQLKDVDGNNVSRSARLELQVVGPDGEIFLSEYSITISTGTMVQPTNSIYGTHAYMVLDTNASGQAVVTVTDLITGASRSVWLRVVPYGTAGYPALGDCGFN